MFLKHLHVESTLDINFIPLYKTVITYYSFKRYQISIYLRDFQLLLRLNIFIYSLESTKYCIKTVKSLKVMSYVRTHTYHFVHRWAKDRTSRSNKAPKWCTKVGTPGHGQASLTEFDTTACAQRSKISYLKTDTESKTHYTNAPRNNQKTLWFQNTTSIKIQNGNGSTKTVERRCSRQKFCCSGTQVAQRQESEYSALDQELKSF